MTTTKTTGGCLCGKVRFETTVEPRWVCHCHCHSCRRNTGAPVTTFVGFDIDRVIYTAGKRKVYESSPGVRRGFCTDCGTPLTYEADRCAHETHIYISAFDEPGRFTPQNHVFFAERVEWLELHDDLPRYDGMSTADEPSAWGPART